MRGALALACLAACGRIGFDEHTGDANGDSQDGSAAVTMWTHLIAYTNGTCAVRSNRAYCWGQNDKGQNGSNVGVDGTRPVAVGLPAGTITALALGDTSGCAIIGGALDCWGSIGAPAPQNIALAQDATAISMGRDFQCVIAGDGECWGTNGVGQLSTNDLMQRTTPTTVMHAPSDPAFVAVEAGDDHACALDANNTALCWGHNDDGVLELPLATDHSALPVKQSTVVHTLPQIAGWHACALVGGTVECWGEGDNGELGDGGSTNSITPVVVTGLTAPTAIATGGGGTDHDSTCAIDGGTVKCWGNGFYGRLGQGSANPSAVPVAVVGLPAAVATEVAVGDDHACAALVDGSMWCWGRGDRGQLGDGRAMSSLTPVLVVAP